MTISNNRTSVLINSQLPQFVRDDHRTFVAFLEDYYKFMEQDGQVLNTVKNFDRYENVDLSEGVYLQELYDTFISLLPKSILADKTLILKHVKDFYRSRGSEKSVRFLMRILLNKEIDFYYPKRDILKASDGKWYIQKSVRIGDVAVNNASNTIAYSNFVAKQIKGLTSGASAVVEQIDRYYDKGQLVTELRLSNEYKSFTSGETVFCFYEEEGITKYLTGNLFSGVVVNVSLANGGFGYIEGSSVPVEGGGGSGAQVVISSVSKGGLGSIGIQAAAAGFRAGDPIIITGGGGSGATAQVGLVDLSEKYHPNSYDIVASVIGLEANTPINNVRFSNLNSSIINPYLDVVSNSMSFWTYSNCGPLQTCDVLTEGNNYTTIPSMDVQSNTIIRYMGILGRMEILNGGLSYVIGDQLIFTNPPGCYGVGAAANVTNVAANGAITEIKFQKMAGHMVGGAGYNPQFLPTVTVNTAAGHGANIIVTATLGEDESLISSYSQSGKILQLKLISGGINYTSAPTINLAAMSSGSGGIATASIVSGAYTYPGRFINDDGFLSSYNFIQDRDFYQNYSYVIRVDESLNKYRKAIKDLVHPAGMKLFGDYVLTDPTDQNLAFSIVTTLSNNIMKVATYNAIIGDITKTGTYTVNILGATYSPQVIPARYNVAPIETTSYTTTVNEIVIGRNLSRIYSGANVWLKFDSALYPNIANGLYTVSRSNANYFIVPVTNSNSAIFHPSELSSNLTLSSGIGAQNAYVTFSKWPANSNVSITQGDSINVSGNTVTVVYAQTGVSTVIVSPAITGNLSAQVFSVIKQPYYAYGNVTIYNPEITVFANSHGLVRGNEAYFKFLSSDTTLQNTSYNIIGANNSQLTILHKDIANATSFAGNVNVQTSQVTVNSVGHGLSNGNTVFVYVDSGDTANAANGFYIVTNATANSFGINTGHSLVSGGNARLLTPNLTINVANHGFASNVNVRIWFVTGDTANVANGDYKVTVRDTNEMYFKVPNFVLSNGTITIYRGYTNVSLYLQSHNFSVGNVAHILLDSGNTDRIANGIYEITSANANYFTIKHTGINVSSNLVNLLPNNTGTLYVS